MPRASKREGRTCAVCGRGFFRRANGDGSFEAPGAFSRRLFCSRTCGAIGRHRRRRAESGEVWLARAREIAK
jgi:hypothetical protein